jgi:hypothetical protein
LQRSETPCSRSSQVALDLFDVGLEIKAGLGQQLDGARVHDGLARRLIRDAKVEGSPKNS